jgi:hypothetical protein
VLFSGWEEERDGWLLIGVQERLLKRFAPQGPYFRGSEDKDAAREMADYALNARAKLSQQAAACEDVISC